MKYKFKLEKGKNHFQMQIKFYIHENFNFHDILKVYSNLKY